MSGCLEIAPGQGVLGILATRSQDFTRNMRISYSWPKPGSADRRLWVSCQP